VLLFFYHPALSLCFVGTNEDEFLNIWNKICIYFNCLIIFYSPYGGICLMVWKI
jgi:hypothetical protein